MTSQLSHSVQIMKNCGAIAAEHIQFLDAFFTTMGASLFETKQIPERIEFLFEFVKTPRFNSSDGPFIIMTSVRLGVHENTIWLNDQKGDFRNLAILIARGVDDDIFSIREFSTDPAEVCGSTLKIKKQICHNILDASPYWNFTFTDDEVAISDPSDAFLDPYKTRAVTNMIVWASNLLGYNANKSH